MRTIVVGAGIVGLAVALELQERGCQVSVLTADAPGSVQSVGASRIFRVHHDAPELVAAGRRALDGWDAWERHFGTPLLDRVGLLISRDFDESDGESPSSVIRRVEGRQHPLSGRDGVWWFERTGAAGRIAEAVKQLSARLTIHHGQARDVAADRVSLSDGRTMSADRVVVCAGIASAELMGYAPTPQHAYTRFSFPLRGRTGEPIPCWMQRDPTISEPFYAVQDGPGHYAVGLSEAVPADAPSDHLLREHEPRVREIVRELFPHLEPTPVRPVHCRFPTLIGGHQDGYSHDGWDLLDNGEVVGVSGPNLFKFAPLLGSLVSDELLGPKPDVAAPA